MPREPRVKQSGAERWFAGPLLMVLLISCGLRPSESKLVGTWQLGENARQQTTYELRADHTYSIKVSAQSGSMDGKWRLEGNVLTTTVESLSAFGLSTAPPTPRGTVFQRVLIVSLNDNSMVWRNSRLSSPIKLKRVTARPLGL